MNKYTVTVPADRLKGIISIPPEFEHQQLEIAISLKKHKEFDPRKFRGAARGSKKQIDEELGVIRREWAAR